MKARDITFSTPIDPILYSWVNSLPFHIRENRCLMDVLMRMVGGIYISGNLRRESGVNPFYKIIEIFNHGKLEYSHLQDIKKYYLFDIIGYLTEGNRGNFYFDNPCNNMQQLRSALCPRNNKTNGDTLISIFSRIL